jgi:hypothetical protein
MTREGMKKYLSQRNKAKPIVQMDTFLLEALVANLNLTGQKINNCHALLRQEALKRNSEHNNKLLA